MPAAPRRRAVSMFSIVCAGVRRYAPMPAQTAAAADGVARGGDLLGEPRRLLRVGHRADRVDEAVLQPAAPVLQACVARFLRGRARPRR